MIHLNCIYFNNPFRVISSVFVLKRCVHMCLGVHILDLKLIVTVLYVGTVKERLVKSLNFIPNYNTLKT